MVLIRLIKNALSGTADPAGKRSQSSKKLEATASNWSGRSAHVDVASSTPSKTPSAGVAAHPSALANAGDDGASRHHRPPPVHGSRYEALPGLVPVAVPVEVPAAPLVPVAALVAGAKSTWPLA